MSDSHNEYISNGKERSFIQKISEEKTDQDFTFEIKDTEYGDVSITGATITKKIQITHALFNSIKFSRCTFQEPVFIEDCLIKKGIILENCAFKDTLYIQTMSSPENKSEYTNTEFTRLIQKNTPLEVLISNCKGNLEFELEPEHCPQTERAFKMKGMHDGSIEISSKNNYPTKESSSDVGTGNFEFTDNEITGSLKIHSINCKELTLTRCKIRGGLAIFDVGINKFGLKEFINLAGRGMIINRLLPRYNNTSFTLDSSDLGQAQFRNIDLTLFQNFTFSHSEIDETISRAAVWPKDIIISEGRSRLSNMLSDDHSNDTQLGLYYRACRDIYKKSGERAMHLKFQKLYMDRLYSDIPWSTENFSAKLSLNASAIFSSHGTNWIKPASLLIIYTIGITLAFHFNSTNGVTTETFFQLLLPTHKFDALGVESSFSNHLLDTLSRLLSGYLIFQTVKSFRSYT